jgi:molybdopterin-containing oxidoreductase family iron-sulfur binding subunit
MGVNRREFLRIAGFTTLLGLGGKSVIDVLSRDKVEAAEVLPNPEALRGKRWAMVIDSKKCLEKVDKDGGCRDCSIACHHVHNVPDFGNPKDEIKWIWNESYEHAFPGQEHQYIEESVKGKPFIVLCNHCDDPPCVRVCPTKATFKRKDGIVMMDYHRCIGCRFCMAGCPFGSRSFNWRDPRPFIKETNPEYPTRTRGVVEKCTFCVERLAQGLLPACVEACREKALVFGDLENPDSEVRNILRSHYAIRRKPELGTMPQVYYIV